MKKHFKKIKEGFAGIWKDSIKYCKNAINNMLPKIKTSAQKIHKSVGITGRIMIGAVIVIWILLAYYTNKANIYQQKNQIGNFENIVIHRPHHIASEFKQSMKDMQKELIQAHNFQQRRIEAPNINSSQSVFVSRNGLQYSFVINDGKITGTIVQDDMNLRGKTVVQLQNLGLSVEQKDNQILFQGNLSSHLPLLQILN